MSEDEKPKFKKKTIELTGWVTVKPRQESQKTERREDIKRRINEELEFLMEMEDRMPRKDEKKRFFKRTSSKNNQRLCSRTNTAKGRQFER